MSHMLVVLKAHGEVEDPAWRLYDEAFQEKMAATGVRAWPGIDVQVYQETCGCYPRKRAERQSFSGRGGAPSGKRPAEGGEGRKPLICWQFNEGALCKYGKACKFPHLCEVCEGGHPKVHCPKRQRMN